jgi:hypothetical protein
LAALSAEGAIGGNNVGWSLHWCRVMPGSLTDNKKLGGTAAARFEDCF